MLSYHLILTDFVKDDRLNRGDKPVKTCVILCHSSCHSKKAWFRLKDDASNIAQAYLLTLLSYLSYLFISIKRNIRLDCKKDNNIKKRSNRNSYIRRTFDEGDKYDNQLKQNKWKRK